MMREMFGALIVLAACAGVCQETAPAPTPAVSKTYVLLREGAAATDALLQDSAAFLEKAGYFYLATCEEGAARVRPIKYTLIVDNKLLFATSMKKEMYAQLLKNPRVELSRTAEDKSAYLRFQGRAVLCTDAEVKARVLEASPNFKTSFGDQLALFAVEPERVGLFPMKGGQAKTKTYTRE